MTVLSHFQAHGRTARGRLTVPQDEKASGRRCAEAPDPIGCRQCAAVTRQQRGAVGRWRDRRGTPSRSVPLIPVAECGIGKEVAVLCHLQARRRTARSRLAVPKNKKTACPCC